MNNISTNFTNYSLYNKYNNRYNQSMRTVTFRADSKENSVNPIAVNNSSSVNFGEQNTKTVLSKFVSNVNEFAKSLFSSNKDKQSDANPPKLPIYYA